MVQRGDFAHAIVRVMSMDSEERMKLIMMMALTNPDAFMSAYNDRRDGHLAHAPLFEAPKPNPEVRIVADRPGVPYVVRLISHGPNKINCIKIIRELTGKCLADAKDTSERTPVDIRTFERKEDAEDACNKFLVVGCHAVVTQHA